MSATPLVLVLLVLLVLLGSTCAARNDRRPRNRNSGRSNACKDRFTHQVTSSALQQRPLTFQCPRGPVADVQTVGVKDACRGQTPDLLMNANRCAWNATCSVEYKGNAMDRVMEGDRSVCVGVTPDTVEISYSCLKNKVDIFNVLGEFARTRKKDGIARSHALYPWSYRNGVRLGNLTFNRPGRPDLVDLWFTVHSLAILDSDVVFLSWQGHSDPRHQVDAIRMIADNDTTFEVENVQSVTLTFYADYQTHHSGIGGQERGFVICFQWLKASGRPKKGSACSKVMQPGRCGGGGGRRGTARSGRNNNRRRNRQQRQ